MGPHAKDLDNTLIFQNLIDKSVLDIDAARIGPFQVAQKLLKRRRLLEGIVWEDGK
jgi:hypothetical protein